MINTTADRVPAHTSDSGNQRIRRQTEANVAYYARHPALIGQRLKELDAEWDIERVLEMGSSTLTVTGLLMSVASSRKWLLLSLAVQGFFMQHVVQGWCPPLPMFRSLGIRTADEINRERYALKALRGDFRQMSVSDASGACPSVDQAIEAVRT